MRRTIFSFLVTSVVLTGCVSKNMKPDTNQAASAVPADSSQIIFLRSSSFGGAVEAHLFDATEGDIKFIGSSMQHSKIRHTTKPGKYLFMVTGESADFMEANLAAGKTYYALVTPRHGVMQARFSLHPVTSQSHRKHTFLSPHIQATLAKGEFVSVAPTSAAWFESNKETFKSLYKSYIPKWDAKHLTEKAERTLLPTDGI